MKRVFVSGAFDDTRSPLIRFLEEAASSGPLTLTLWPDSAIEKALGEPPKMSLAERLYYFGGLRFVERVVAGPGDLDPDGLAAADGSVRPEAGDVWAVCAALCPEAERANGKKTAWCRSRGMELLDVPASALAGFPYAPPPYGAPVKDGRKRVVATGCYDWLHTGHLRFFEEASEYGELTVVIGSDANVSLLKGAGHPLYGELERRYVVASFKDVARCLVSSGTGWLDAEPEIRALKADRYVVNEDGDKPEKRAFCEANGIEYIVLKRVPKEGLPRRSSTDLRGY
jgi:cytidyltransferase-like protein